MRWDTGPDAPSVEEQKRWATWANERAAVRAKQAPKPTAEPHDADWHARAIRRAIEDARRDGMVVDFGWDGFADQHQWYVCVVHEGTAWSKAVRIWPPPQRA